MNAPFDWIELAQKGGSYVSPLLLGALIWMNADRARLIQELKSKDEKLESLAERLIIVATEVRTFLFNERKAD